MWIRIKIKNKGKNIELKLSLSLYKKSEETRRKKRKKFGLLSHHLKMKQRTLPSNLKFLETKLELVRSIKLTCPKIESIKLL